MSDAIHTATNIPESYRLIVDAIRTHYRTNDFIPLHAPSVGEAEKQKLNECIDSTFVSTVGQFVTDFEQQFRQFVGSNHALSVVNGTMGLFLALKTLGVEKNDLVLTQSLTFVATANAIKMAHAEPFFIDVDKETYSLSLDVLKQFLENQTTQQQGRCVHKQSGKTIAVCMPMHTLGFVGDIEQIVSLCHSHNIKVIEDAAESLGSYIGRQHSGTFADIGVFSFNGNKIMTTGGGGMLVTQHQDYAHRARHLSTTAKKTHPWLFEHDEIGFNLRMPNINAALGLAQLQKLPAFIEEKRALAQWYQTRFSDIDGINVVSPKQSQTANQWLNGLVFESLEARDQFLAYSNQQQVQTRPLWTPMHQLDIYQHCIRTQMDNTEWLAQRVVNIPSGIRHHG